MSQLTSTQQAELLQFLWCGPISETEFAQLLQEHCQLSLASVSPADALFSFKAYKAVDHLSRNYRTRCLVQGLAEVFQENPQFQVWVVANQTHQWPMRFFSLLGTRGIFIATSALVLILGFNLGLLLAGFRDRASLVEPKIGLATAKSLERDAPLLYGWLATAQKSDEAYLAVFPASAGATEFHARRIRPLLKEYKLTVWATVDRSGGREDEMLEVTPDEVGLRIERAQLAAGDSVKLLIAIERPGDCPLPTEDDVFRFLVFEEM